jgi:hypothetical protein
MTKSALEYITNELELFFEPINARLRAGTVIDLMAELGWYWPEEVDLDVSTVVDSLDMLVEALGSLNSDSDVPEYINAIKAAADIASAIADLGDNLPRPSDFTGDIANALQVINDNAEQIGKRALSLLIVRYLETKLPAILGFLRLFGVIQISRIPPDHSSPGFNSIEIDWGKIPVLITSPDKLFGELYEWDQQTSLKHDELLGGLKLIAYGLGLPASLRATPLRLERAILRAMGADTSVVRLGRQLKIPLYQVFSEDSGSAELGLRVIGTPDPNQPSHGIKGIAFVPYGVGKTQISGEITKELTFETRGNFGVDTAILLLPGGRVALLEGLFTTGGLDLEVAVGLALKQADSPYVIFGSKRGSRFEYSSLDVNAGLFGSPSDPDFYVELALREASIVVQGSEGDSFLSQLFPKDPLVVTLDSTVGLSSKRGFYFGGSGGFDVTIPLHLSQGPVKIDSAYLALNVAISEYSNVVARIGLSASAELGPLSASIQRIGVKSFLSFPEDGGNLGSADLDIGFLPPTGAGFSLNASGITGGGFLEFDKINERYAGILALKLGEIGITAIGLITTKLPDGSKGFSMLVNIGINFNPPIQLSMGFTLSGVGGLIGVNRTMVIDVLQEGIKKGTLDSILFPDPDWVIPNANKVISDLRSVFFPTKGRFVIGPMLKIGYGTPNFITGEIGIFMELPDPVRIVLLGQVEMSLPEPSVQAIGVNIDILGVLDIQKRELSFQAAINASSLMAFALVGDCAFLLRWGQKPELALALGGFHPRFTPPAPTGIFANLRRLGVTIYYGPLVVLGCRGYLALTPNSLQFGGRVDVFIGISQLNLGISGFLSFDALIYFDPFSFNVAIAGGVAVSVGDFSLANVRVNFILSGPTPWDIHGKGRVKVLFFDIGVRFHITWGQQGKALEAIDPWPKVRDALSQATSWGSRLPEGTASVVALHQTKAGADDDDTIVVHPAGILEIRQTVAPLDLRLSKLGNAPVKTHDMVRIDRIVAGSDDELELTPVEEYFARGQFEDLTDAQQISTPAFEHMKAGVMVAGSTRIQTHGAIESAALDYESILIDSESVTQPPRPAVVDWSVANRLVAGAAPARARKQGAARYANIKPPVVTVEDEPSVVVDAATMEPVDLSETIGISNRRFSRIAADQALADLVAARRVSPHSVVVTTASTAQPAGIRR